MASLLRHTARRRCVSTGNGNGNANTTTRAWSSCTRLQNTNVEALDHAQEREAALFRKHQVSKKPDVPRSIPHRRPRDISHSFKASNGATRKSKVRQADTPESAIRKSHVSQSATKDRPDRLANAKVSVPSATGSHSFSAVFLRDLCSCSRCVDSSTRQKLFVTADIPEKIEAADVQSDGEDIRIKWNNDVPGYSTDHTTELSLALLSKYATTGDNLPKQDVTPRVLWDAQMYQQQTQDFTYEAYMEDDTVLLKALRQLQSHGLLFVINVPGDEKSVKRLSNRIGPLKTTFYGETWDVRSVPQAKNVAYTSQNLGFHMDLMYMKQPPHLQLLHCIRSSSSGGASLFTDSFKAAVHLYHNDQDGFSALSKIRVGYHYDHETDYYHQARPVVEQQKARGLLYQENLAMRRRTTAATGRGLGPAESIDNVSWSPPFQAPFRLDDQLDDRHANQGDMLLSRKIDPWHNAARKFNEQIHRPEAIYERLMKPGECVIFDNRRVLHARKAFEVGDQGKERWLRGAYIDKDPFISKLKILSERYGDVNEAAEGNLEPADRYFEMQTEA
ncbi:hypothetical protein DOTSEDRAFT_68995 [Dothistroma septosporum NZE10]|uniref:TauD/TfdA-like domain-containing protein n=1 Tax=Dothistroma septosporum (strain NZE10 / CBS 128990) TaxID=675120 RepID=N1Q5G8_DOTSN|nr:hypothetical protein DOTSEDRAFT_68995 [Dothistroma septosporum NZE10]